MVSQLDFHPMNPFRAVTWRWDRAGNIVDGGPKLSRKRDDPWIRRAAALRAGIEKSHDEAGLAVLMVNDPPVYWAYQAWRMRDSAVGGHRILPHGLEARLLATQPYDLIAYRSSVHSEAVEAYGKLFYDIENRHDQIDYIAAMCLGPSVYTGIRAREYDLIWKLFGWGLGPGMVDLLMMTFPARQHLTDGTAAMAGGMDAGKGSTIVNGMVASKTMAINGFNANMIQDSFLKYCELEAKGGKDGGAQATILTHVEAMMHVLPFRVGGSSPPEAVAGRHIVVPGLEAADMSRAELRGEELVRLGTGQEVEDVSNRPSPFRPRALPAPESAPVGV